MDKHFSEANLLFSLLPYQRRGKKKRKAFFSFLLWSFFFLFSLWKKIFKKKKEYKTKLLWYVGHDSVNAKREKLVIPGTHTISAAFLWALFLFFFFSFPHICCLFFGVRAHVKSLQHLWMILGWNSPIFSSFCSKAFLFLFDWENRKKEKTIERKSVESWLRNRKIACSHSIALLTIHLYIRQIMFEGTCLF